MQFILILLVWIGAILFVVAFIGSIIGIIGSVVIKIFILLIRFMAYPAVLGSISFPIAAYCLSRIFIKGGEGDMEDLWTIIKCHPLNLPENGLQRVCIDIMAFILEGAIVLSGFHLRSFISILNYPEWGTAFELIFISIGIIGLQIGIYAVGEKIWEKDDDLITKIDKCPFPFILDKISGKMPL